MTAWNRAFKDDYVEPSPISNNDMAKVLECELKPSCGLKTWNDVFLNGVYLGMVRTKLGGNHEYRLSRNDSPVYCGQIGNTGDPKHARAILALRIKLVV